MTTICNRLPAFLDERRIAYSVLRHRSDFTAQETAADTHTPGREFAKTVVVKTDEKYVMVVLPAHHRIHFGKLREALGASTVRLATEAEMRELFPDCEVGAEPPFGNLYGMPVYVSAAMIGDERITFNAGTHEDVVRMGFRDYVMAVGPRAIECSEAGR